VALFSHLDFHGYGELHLAFDRDTGLRSLIAIHDTRLGPVLGGCRFLPYPGLDQVAVDAIRLGRAMTHKAALANLPLGGGMAVLWKPIGMDARLAVGTPFRRTLFRTFGRAVDGLGGRFIAATDAGTTPADMADIAAETKHVVGLPEDKGGVGDPSPYGARGVLRGMAAAAKEVLGRDSLEGLHVAIQGVGHVGLEIAKALDAAGCRLTVADVAFSRLKLCQRQVSREIAMADIDDIIDTECDIFAPCALGGAIQRETVQRLRCKIVAGAANNQLADDMVDDALQQKGIFWAPDYAMNAGGLIWLAQTACGLSPQDAIGRVDGIYDTIREIARRARSSSFPPGAMADRMVAEKLALANR
jgi:leucine dehydrogenase